MSKIYMKGFLVKDVSSIQDLEAALYNIQEVIQQAAGKAYENLVQKQVERIIDEVTLGMYQCPEDKSVIDIAFNEVNMKIIQAEQNSDHTEFNLYMGIQILISQIDGKPVVYFKVNTLNELYEKKLSKIKNLEPYNITEDDIKAKKDKAAFWENVNLKYQDNIPLESVIVHYNELNCDFSKMKFRTPQERAHDLAVEKIMNHLLSCYGCRQEIPPAKLMEYTMQAMSRLKHPDMIEAVNLEEEALKQVLPDIKKALSQARN